ncbi:DNA cytosine methyltransferase, partial [Desulfovibrio desulfuricans]|uniref:DNA cytosine methyltransferase n=2 Tax=Bacteria TaxID=2 RepID=UPI001D05EB63
GGEIIDAIVEAFSDCGYDVHYKLLNAKNYGVPEDRERVIIVGFRKDLGITEFDYPESSNKIVTMREALSKVPAP